jgi:membrane-associated phospholipid phosphatase
VWTARRGHSVEGVALVLALAATWAAVHIAKAALDRPRPAGQHVDTVGEAYPSGHAAYAIAFIACAVVLSRGESRLAARFAVVGIAVAIAAGVGISRVYLRVHYLSDVLGGFALATAIFALGGLATLVVGLVSHNRN